MTKEKIEYRGHTIGMGQVWRGVFCPIIPHARYAANISGPAVNMIVMARTSDEAIEKAKREIDEVLKGR